MQSGSSTPRRDPKRRRGGRVAPLSPQGAFDSISYPFVSPVANAMEVKRRVSPLKVQICDTPAPKRVRSDEITEDGMSEEDDDLVPSYQNYQQSVPSSLRKTPRNVKRVPKVEESMDQGDIQQREVQVYCERMKSQWKEQTLLPAINNAREAGYYHGFHDAISLIHGKSNNNTQHQNIN